MPANPLIIPIDQVGDGRAASPIVGIEPLLIGSKEAASLCGVSRATWWRLVSAGKTPRPRRLGGRTLFDVAELRGWVAAGCPDQSTWEARRGKR